MSFEAFFKGWLGEQGFRTRNTKRLQDAQGNLSAGSRLFATASVRGILRNPFYAGKITHRGKLLPSIHEPLVSEDLFETVQTIMKKNSGRSETLQVRPERHYLLKGIVRLCLLRNADVGTDLQKRQALL